MKTSAWALSLLILVPLMAGITPGLAQEKILYNFGATSTDGQVPYSGLIADAKGNFYGTTRAGGAYGASNGGYGTVFELSPGSNGTWTERILYSFGAVSPDGSNPVAGLVFDTKGNLYGTTSGSDSGLGAVFELSPEAGGNWSEKLLFNFDENTQVGNSPQAPLILDAKGNLYGTVARGPEFQPYAEGGAFELSPSPSGEWTVNALTIFGAYSTSFYPAAPVVFDQQGNLYGTTIGGNGSVFELTPTADGKWTQTVLYQFGANGDLKHDGLNPGAGLIFDAAGNLYGTTEEGGLYGGGIVFELVHGTGGAWTEKILHNFGATPTDGFAPYAGLVMDALGNLFGTTEQGGDSTGLDEGVVFELTPAANGTWTEKTLHAFAQFTTDGVSPLAGLFRDEAGNIYGTTPSGGAHNAGAVFEIPATAAVPPQFSVNPGAYPSAQTLKLTDGTPGATVYYTTNGETPTTASLKYAEPIEIEESETVKAIATATALTPSSVATASYVIEVPAAKPEFSLAPGTYDKAVIVAITDATPHAQVHFALNGVTPTVASTLYTAPISVAKNTTLKAIATAPDFLESPIASATYTITPPAATPEISPLPGTYTSPQAVRMACATAGSTIYYTVNGELPTAASTKYTGPISVAATETIKAIALAPGYSHSATLSAAFTIERPTAAPTFSPPAGTYKSSQKVAIVDATSGATIFYTTHGATPTASSLKYTTPLTVSATETIKAIAIAPGSTPSPPSAATYTIP